MRFARTPLPPLVALPLAFWACSETTPPPTQAGDATVREDAAGPRDAAPGADAAPGFDDAATFDAGMFFADAAAMFPDATAACAYPSGAAEPMALDRVLTPYAWPSAIDGANADFPLDLAQAFCDTDPNRTWSAYDVILFVTAPAW